jgi:hypothetical protein
MSWVLIPNYPEYAVSACGKVKSFDREVIQISRHGTPMTRTYKGTLLKQKVSPHGYMQVTLNNQYEGKRTFNVHSLVAKAFVDGYDGGLEVNHKDGVKTHNWASNLEWVTSQRNSEHAFATGLANIPFGRESNACKGWIEAVDLAGNVVATFAGEAQCRALGFTPAGVSAVITGRQKKHRNLYFRWKEDV